MSEQLQTKCDPTCPSQILQFYNIDYDNEYELICPYCQKELMIEKAQA